MGMEVEYGVWFVRTIFFRIGLVGDEVVRERQDGNP
jgi:hypothetical protein